jgi:hypothetical protein
MNLAKWSVVHFAVMVVLWPLVVLATPTPAEVGVGQSDVRPPAFRFTLSATGAVAGSSFALSGTGVANQTGELKATLGLSQPQNHTIDLIGVADTVYASVDGAAYQVLNGGGATSGSLGAASFSGSLAASSAAQTSPECVASEARLGAYLQRDIFRLIEGTDSSFQVLGVESIDGVSTKHVQGSVAVGTILTDPLLLSVGQAVFTACGTPLPDVSPLLMQLALLGSTVTLDANLEQPSGIPRRFSMDLAMPLLAVRLSLQGDLTPLQSPIIVTLPGS